MAPTDISPLVAKAERIAKQFEYPAEGQRGVRNGVKEFLRLMDDGLQNDGRDMTMIPTYVTSVPNGTEKGVYLAVDLGGTNFRVCSVTLNGDTTFNIVQSKVEVDDAHKTGTAEGLFGFMAEQVKKFVEQHHGDHFATRPDHKLQLGFTFSFPVDQKAVNSGFLIRWTKGFNIADAVGKDVCALLQAEIDKLGLPVTVAALVNDTVGTLMARSYTSPGETGTLLGAIFGTGTNGAYVEKLSKITKMTAPGSTFGPFDKSTGEMVVNTEWGSFDNLMRVLPDTPYDQKLDKISINPGMQMFEKRVSGMFLGEILRHVLVDLHDNHQMFAEASVPADAKLHEKFTVDTSALSYIEADDTADLEHTKRVLRDQLGIPTATADEATAIKRIVHAIGVRAARLSAVPIAAIVIATGKLAPTAETLPIEKLSLLDQGIAAVKAAIMGQPPAADLPASGGVKAGKTAVETQEMSVIDVGVDGSVVEFYPGFEDNVRQALREVSEFGEHGERRIRMGVAKDGSGVGAALIALVAAKAAGITVE